MAAPKTSDIGARPEFWLGLGETSAVEAASLCLTAGTQASARISRIFNYRERPEIALQVIQRSNAFCFSMNRSAIFENSGAIENALANRGGEIKRLGFGRGSDDVE